MQQQPETATTEEFMAVAAHDLRNPIAVVRASAQMAQRQITRGDAPAAQARLQAIVEQTDRVTEMIESFLDAARIECGKLPMRPERLDARDLIELAAERARVMVADHAQRAIEVDVPDGCIGAWDRQRVIRAVRALLTNAWQYGDPTMPVRVHGTRSDSRLVLEISGGGPGPDNDEARHLFERFFRGRSAAEAGQAGSGLGLFTARGIARVHGGDVRWLDGDRFEIELPLAD